MANDKTTFTPRFIANMNRAILGGVTGYEIAALHAVQGAMLQRIHNKRQASDESSLGKYKNPAYKEKRKAAGRQTDGKDLEFHGDLRRSVKVGTTGGRNSMGFDKDMARLIAEGQTGQIKKQIYELSDAEEREMLSTYARLLNRRINKFNNRNRV